MRAPASRPGRRGSGSRSRPNVANTAVSASSSGIPAATSVPKATRRMTSVTGSDSSPALPRSSPYAVTRASTLLASPNSPMKSCGCAFCSSSTRSRTGPIRSTAVSGSPRIWSPTRAACPFGAICPLFAGARGERTCWTASSFEIAATTSWTAARNSGSLVRRVELWTRMLSPAGCGNPASRILSMRPDSPGPGASASSVFMPTMPPIPNETTTKASQPNVAVFQCVALQRPMRAAMLRFGAWCGTCRSSFVCRAWGDRAPWLDARRQAAP